MALTQISTGGIKDDAVTDAKLPANSVGNSEMKDDAVGVAELSATGTASSSTFLRGDNSWVTPTDTNTQLAFANDANNRVVTGTGSGLNGEANLNFDGSNLLIGTTTLGQSNGDDLTIAGDGARGLTIRSNDSGNCHIYMSDATSGTGQYDGYLAYVHADQEWHIGSGATQRWKLKNNGNLEIADGDLVIGTAGHGIDFSANSHASGMTSELLDSYEEGTWTPTFPHQGTGNQTAGTNIGRYTKIGRFVYLFVYMTSMTGAPQNNSSGWKIGGIPFTPDSTTLGHHGFGNISYCGTQDYSPWRPLVDPDNNEIYFHRCNGSNGTLENDDVYSTGMTHFIVGVNYMVAA